MIGISLLPVLLYKKMPLLKDNTQWSIRAFLSFAMLYFPYSYYDKKFVQKDVREIKERYYHKYGHNYKNYLLTNDERYLNP